MNIEGNEESTNPIKFPMNWEQAVAWTRSQPELMDMVQNCYFDDPISEAAQRFYSSEEWIETRKLFPEKVGIALDVGAGRGISSFALAKDGWIVTALEPDPSNLVGTGSIKQLRKESGLSIEIVSNCGESLPFPDDSFDLVYCRQVLHHANDLHAFMQEVSRVLKPGGFFVATREHVVDSPEDLQDFLAQHPLHRLYGGENAFTLHHYVSCIADAKLCFCNILATFDSIINYWPAPLENYTNFLREKWEWKLEPTQTDLIKMGRQYFNFAGRNFSFIAKKPVNIDTRECENTSALKILFESLYDHQITLINKQKFLIQENLLRIELQAQQIESQNQQIEAQLHLNQELHDKINTLEMRFVKFQYKLTHPFKTILLKIKGFFHKHNHIL